MTSSAPHATPSRDPTKVDMRFETHAQKRAAAGFVRRLIDAASAPYRPAGLFAWRFARGKLAGDPVFAALLAHGLFPDAARIVDIGCGQGLLASWLQAADALHRQGCWPVHWPAAPGTVSVHGIELMAADVRRARTALGEDARLTAGDMRVVDFGQADVVVLLDVLHYVDHAAQTDILDRLRNALEPGGRLILRVGNAAAGWRFRYSTWVDRIVSLARSHHTVTLHCRTLDDWRTTLCGLGFSVRVVPMQGGTPFADTLLVADLDTDTLPGRSFDKINMHATFRET